MDTPIPAQKFVLEFTKMSGAGNDFIVIDNRFYAFTSDELSGFASRFCRRREGVGADGLLALSNAASAEADYRMTYFNADGSVGTMCGNGARCLARFARDAGLESEPLFFDSDAGLYRASVAELGDVRLYVPAPRNFKSVVQLSNPLPDGSKKAHYLWTGTEHVVVFVDDVSSVDVVRLGRAIRHDEILGAEGANVNFVEQQDAGNLKVRTFEKGVEDETLACGTGSIASSIVAALTARSDSKQFAVHMRGGTLEIGFEGNADAPENLYLQGAADVIYRGSLEL